MRAADPEAALAELASQGACVEYREDFLTPERAEALLARLLGELVFDPPERTRIRQPFTGRWVDIPRRQAAYGDPGTSYRFSGITFAAQPWVPVLAELRDEIAAATGFQSNFVLVNHYRDGADYLGWHSDDEKDMGEEPTILSLSLGGPRDFQLRKRKAGLPTVTLPLASGSLLALRHPTNRDFKHQLPRRGGSRPERVPARLNLTWRRTRSLGAEAG